MKWHHWLVCKTHPSFKTLIWECCSGIMPQGDVHYVWTATINQLPALYLLTAAAVNRIVEWQIPCRIITSIWLQMMLIELQKSGNGVEWRYFMTFVWFIGITRGTMAVDPNIDKTITIIVWNLLWKMYLVQTTSPKNDYSNTSPLELSNNPGITECFSR